MPSGAVRALGGPRQRARGDVGGRSYGAVVAERTVPLIQERIYDPPRAVEVEQDGRWLPAVQRSCHLWDDDRGWVAQVEYTVVQP